MSNDIDWKTSLDYSGMQFVIDRWVVIEGMVHCLAGYAVGGYVGFNSIDDTIRIIPASDIKHEPLFETEEEAEISML
tara:strand:- start:2328 stop:2558 length:231 start_codon:yes stop_codon:yes gene_type:complete